MPFRDVKSKEKYIKLKDCSAKFCFSKFRILNSNYKKIFIILIISLLCFLFFGISYFYILLPSHFFAAADYVKCLNKKAYDKVLEYYINIPERAAANEEIVYNALKNKYDDAEKIVIKKFIQSQNQAGFDVEIEVIKNGYKIKDVFSLIKVEKGSDNNRRWEVLFPFKTKDLLIYGPDGSTVFEDGIEAGTIMNGYIKIPDVLYGEHYYNALIQNMAESEYIKTFIDENDDTLNIELKPTEEFKKGIEKLIDDFCNGWSKFCLSRNSEYIKNYLTEKMFKELTNDTEIFRGSIYEKCEYTFDLKKIIINSKYSVTVETDEKWNLKESIYEPGLFFYLNGKTILEQNQYIYWRYKLIYDKDSWKIDTADQISFRQEILK